VEYVQDLIRKRNLMPDAPPLEIENWPYPLKIYTLGRFSILKDGKPLPFSRKAQKKPLEMLKALIAFGGREVSVEQLSDALWPDADGDTAYRAFITTLSRLRRLLGYKQAILFQEGLLTLEPRHFWVDTRAFEHLLEKVDTAGEETDRNLYLIKKAISLYRGPFLSNEMEHPWAISIQERLRDKFLWCIGKLGKRYEQGGAWEEAANCYRKGLEVDALTEEFYQHLMVCYQKQGQRAKALSIYERCRKTLSAAFGASPSPETEAILASVKRQKGESEKW